MLKKSLTYLLFLLILTGCSDTLDFTPDTSIDNNGIVQLTLDIPEIVKHNARSTDPEFRVDDVTVIIFEGDGENTTAVQIDSIFLDSSKNTLPNKLEELNDNQLSLIFRLDKNLRGKKDLRFYFIANNPVEISSITENDLKTKKVYSVMKVSDGGTQLLIMNGKASYQEILDKTTVALYRNAAKVTVSNKVPDVETDNLVFYPYDLFGDADEIPMLSSILTENNLGASTKEIPSQSLTDLTDSEPKYFLPTSNQQNTIGIGGDLFVITKAQYNNTEYFYRLDFVEKKTKDDNETVTYIDAKTNHWYQFVILEVTGPGYPTPAEAALHPENGVKYEIHDHSPVSYNMQSDGFRELGVSHLIEYNGIANGNNEWSEQEIYVKFFSKDATEEPAVNEVKSLIKIEDPSWLELSEPEAVTDPDKVGLNGFGDDRNDPGKVYSLKLRFKQTNLIGTLNNKIIVKWMGLEREVPVIWERSFNGSQVSSAALTIHYDGNSTPINDYWTFLSSTDDPEGVKDNALWGVQTDANNGKVRNQGFHFPVMYGSSDTRLATYCYVLTFDKENKFKKSNVKSVTVSQPTDSHVTCALKDENNYYSYTLTRDNSDKYAYQTGKISFTFTFMDESQESYSFDTYHTGFFHKDNQTHRLDEQDSDNYYYYEVVPVIIGGKTRYLLDRNLAAKSAQMYVRDSNGDTALGNPATAGGYYTVAYQEWDGNHSAYKDPIMYDDTDNRVSPPGYRVPLKNAWDALRISPDFHTESVNRYFPVYYVTGNPQIGNVYFPKAMMYSNDSHTIMGESRTGYYWTGTAATGTEKDEIGKWLNMLVLTGSSTSFANGCVNVLNDAQLAYGVSVRCINDVPDDTQTKVTSLNVSGATHVYLYTEAGGTRTATTSWPGHAIGNYSTMSGEQWFGFTYESTQFDPDQLYVIFNFVAEDGRIYTYSQRSDGTTQCTTNLTPGQCQGWKVIGDTNSSIVPEDGYTTVDNIELMPANVTALNNWWRCGGRTDGKPFVYDYQKAPRTLYLVGDATPGKWELSDATPVNSRIPGIYTTDLFLSLGELKACFTLDWGADFFRPEINMTEISADGVTNHKMGEWKEVSSANDYKWKVVTPGDYTLTFDINNMTFDAVYHYSPTPPEGYIRIFVDNIANWSQINLWYWRNTPTLYEYGNKWPGPAMSQVPGTESVWFLDIPSDVENIIWNNGNHGKQSPTQPLSGGQNTYTFTNEGM